MLPDPVWIGSYPGGMLGVTYWQSCSLEHAFPLWSVGASSLPRSPPRLPRPAWCACASWPGKGRKDARFLCSAKPCPLFLESVVLGGVRQFYLCGMCVHLSFWLNCLEGVAVVTLYHQHPTQSPLRAPSRPLASAAVTGCSWHAVGP